MPEVPALSTDLPNVRHAIEEYLDQLPPGTTADRRKVVEVALQTLLQPAFDEPIGTLTPLRLMMLGSQLKSSTSPKTGRRLASSTFRRYILAGQTFLTWCTQRWPRQAERRSSAPAGEMPRQHLGELIRLLRTDAGLTRQQVGEATVGAIALKQIELGRRLPTRRELALLVAEPALAGLLEWAKRENIPIELADSTSETGPGKGDLP